MYPFLSSYETLALRHFNLDAIHSGLREDSLRHELKPALGSFGYIKTVVNKHSNTPQFAHPVVINKDGEWECYVDMRGSVAQTSASGEFKVKDSREYNFRALRGALEHAWQMDEVRDQLRVASDVPIEIYTRNISETLTQRLGLDPEHQAQLAVLAGFFYLGLFESSTDEKLYQKNLAIVARVTRVPASRILEWFPEPMDFENLEQFCYKAQEYIQTPRLKALNPPFMFAIFGNGWFTQNGNEVLCAALEFPPLWIACCYYAVDERAMRNSRIGKLLQRVSKGGQDRLFQRAVSTLIN